MSEREPDYDRAPHGRKVERGCRWRIPTFPTWSSDCGEVQHPFPTHLRGMGFGGRSQTGRYWQNSRECHGLIQADDGYNSPDQAAEEGLIGRQGFSAALRLSRRWREKEDEKSTSSTLSQAPSFADTDILRIAETGCRAFWRMATYPWPLRILSTSNCGAGKSNRLETTTDRGRRPQTSSIRLRERFCQKTLTINVPRTPQNAHRANGKRNAPT